MEQKIIGYGFWSEKAFELHSRVASFQNPRSSLFNIYLTEDEREIAVTTISTDSEGIYKNCLLSAPVTQPE